MNKYAAMIADTGKETEESGGVFDQIGNTKDGTPIFSPSDAGDLLDLARLREAVRSVAGTHGKNINAKAR